MAFITELARWAKGEQSYTALAEASQLSVHPRADIGLTTGRTRSWIERGKTDATYTVRCANLTRDPALLTKLAKDRRVMVRNTVMRNPMTPYEIVAMARAKDSSPDVRRHAEDELKRRFAKFTGDEAVALLGDNGVERTIEYVCSHRRLEDRHIQALWDMKLKVYNKWSNDRVVELLSHLVQRADLHKFSDETLLGIAARGQGAFAARAMVRKRGDVVSLLDALETAVKLDVYAVGSIAAMKGLDPVLAQRIYALADTHRSDIVLTQLAENPAVDWRMFLDAKVRRATVPALGRALAEQFRDDPALWTLAVKLCDNPTTIGEVLAVLSVTHPEALEEPLGS